MQRVETSAERIENWLSEHRLELATEKTEAVILRGPRRHEVTFTIGGAEIRPSRSVKYLGVVLDDLQTFGEHTKAAVRKAEASTAALSRLMPNIGGPSSGKRAVLSGVAHSVLLYGAPICPAEGATESGLRLQNDIDQGDTGHNRHPPIHLLAKRHGYNIEANRRRARDQTVAEWQEEWKENEETGQWTKKLIPELIPEIGETRNMEFLENQ
ncbi:hypothetical protein JTB14_032039 [Gonioctena quinquepunctata]|nr:hypothetical protein JTB14_032039 [Gonioctena quinquepunctata]